MKFTWGTGIFIFLIIFVLSIGTFVVFAFNQDINLVNKQYYQKGVDFDNERLKREKGNEKADKIKIEQNRDEVAISIDKDFFSTIEDVEAYFYRPSDRHLDQRLRFKSGYMIVPKKELIKGRYSLNISWKSNGEDYLLEKYIFVKK